MLYYKKMNKKQIFAISAITALLIISVIPLYILNVNTIYNGISLGGIDLSGQNMTKARMLLEQSEENKYDRNVLTLRCGKNSWKLALNDISLRLDTEESLKNAFSIGRNGNVLNRLYQIVALRFDSINIKPVISYKSEKIRNMIENIKSKIDKKEKNATISYKNGRITIEREDIGKNVPVDKNMELVENQINKSDFKDIELYVEELVPRIKYNDIKDIDGVSGYFKTSFNPQDENRNHNIRLGCERIEKTILMPNDIFSMNQALGPRTLENGYREAPVIFKNELVPGTGGGICQITSTLYNAVLLSKNDVLQRTHHSWPLGYIDPGRDATIAEDYIDFKFQNSSGYPIAISTDITGSNLTVRILGKRTDSNVTVKLKNEILEEFQPDGEEIIIDNSLQDNEKVIAREAKKGMKVLLYRETYSNDGELLEREKISEDIYKPVKQQIKVNKNYVDNKIAN